MPAPFFFSHMATKRYFNKRSVVTVPVRMAGKMRRITFTPVTGEGSEYVTSNEAEQQALESSRYYGRMFRSEDVVSKIAPKKVIPTKQTGPKRVDVACFQDAKDYLFIHFEESLTRMRSKAAVIKMAAKHDIEFYINGEQLATE